MTLSLKILFDVQNTIKMLPSVKELQSLGENLKEALNENHPLLYDLLRWILTSIRAHITPHSGNGNVNYNQDFTFEMKTAPYETELKFQQLKEKHRSIFVFHGSPLLNWHSIMRIGLKNYSNTKFQSNGAAFGEGNYFSDDINLSYGYAHKNAGWNNSLIGTNLSCIAMCEIINSKNCDGIHKPKCPHNTSSPHYRVVNESMVITRYLLIYTKNHPIKKN